MKFNWGHGITLFIIAFVGFIILMVVKAFNTSTDLTAENYYSQELNYGERITAISNSNQLNSSMEITTSTDEIEVLLPAELLMDGAEGQIYFYRPDNASLDLRFDIDPTRNPQMISKKELLPGTYSLQVSCVANEKNYYFDQTITIAN